MDRPIGISPVKCEGEHQHPALALVDFEHQRIARCRKGKWNPIANIEPTVICEFDLGQVAEFR